MTDFFNTIGIAGIKTTIAQDFISRLHKGEYKPTVHAIERGGIETQYEKYLFCNGYLKGDSSLEISTADFARTMLDNFHHTVLMCDAILANNPKARICIIGSESGFQGSYDMSYAGAKAALHLYIESKRLVHPEQQLVGIAPTIILDSGMTKRRDDLDKVIIAGADRRRKGWLKASDVGRLAYFLLCRDEGSLCNTVIRQTGGNY